MTKKNVIEEAVSVVVRGNFNPAIFSPGWLLANELIGAKEAEDVRIEAITSQVAIFEVAWLRCEVTDDRLRYSTAMPQEYERLRDLTIGTLKKLEHTPINLLGINRGFQVQLPSFESWHALGDALLPKDPWEDVLKLPGLFNLVVQGVREDNFGGFVRVTLQPSQRTLHGLSVEHNDHFVLKHVDSQPETRDDFLGAVSDMNLKPSPSHIPIAIEVLGGRWEDSESRADRILDKVLSLVDSK